MDPATNRVVAEIPIRAGSPDGGADHVAVGNSSSHLAAYGGAVWAMVQVEEFRLVRVDPRTMHVVASEEFRPFYSIAPGGLAAGGGYVWFSSGDRLARIAP